jgi:hypothetical protein
MSRAALLASGLLVAIVGSGCGIGTGADRRQAGTAAQTLYEAVRRHDGDLACAQMSPALRAQLVGDAGGRCAEAVLKLQLNGGSALSVRVYADEAIVRLRGGDTVFLGDTSQGWRVDAVGCRPDGPGPYDCEEQA